MQELVTAVCGLNWEFLILGVLTSPKSVIQWLYNDKSRIFNDRTEERNDRARGDDNEDQEALAGTGP